MFGNVHYLNNLSLKSDHTNLQERASSSYGPNKHKGGLLALGNPWAKLIVWKKDSVFISYYLIEPHHISITQDTAED